VSALDNLYGGGIIANGLGQGLQGITEGYRLERELDNQAAMAQSMGLYRQAMGGAANARAGSYDARAQFTDKELENLRAGLKPDGSPATAPGSNTPPNPAAVLTALSKTQYASDPVQLQGAMKKMLSGQAPDPFVPRARAAATAPAAAAAAPAAPGFLAAHLPGLFGSGAPAQAPIAPGQAAGGATAAPAPVSPAAAVNAGAGAPAYNWRAALKPTGPQPGQPQAVAAQ